RRARAAGGEPPAAQRAAGVDGRRAHAGRALSSRSVSTPASAESVEIVELPTRVVVGELVAAPFDRLYVEVPAAWRRFTASGVAHGAPLAEASFTTASGYVEVVGALRDVGAVAVPAGHVPVLVPA